MKIEDILDDKVINTELVADNKLEAIKSLSTLLYENDYIDDIEGFIEDIYKREEKGVTGIGNFISIPHGLSKHVLKTGLAIGISNQEIPWETLDDKGVKVVILFAVSDHGDGSNEHLKVLSTIARKIGNNDVVESLLNSRTSHDVIESFTR